MTTIPDIVEPLIGYRWFYGGCHSGGGPDGNLIVHCGKTQINNCDVLFGLWLSKPWLIHGPNRAECALSTMLYNRSHNIANCLDAPSNKHPTFLPGCGFYSYKMPQKNHYKDDYLRIHAKIYLWGKVYEHELGYRSQFAQIISLDNAVLAAKFNLPHEELSGA